MLETNGEAMGLFTRTIGNWSSSGKTVAKDAAYYAGVLFKVEYMFESSEMLDKLSGLIFEVSEIQENADLYCKKDILNSERQCVLTSKCSMLLMKSIYFINREELDNAATNLLEVALTMEIMLRFMESFGPNDILAKFAETIRPIYTKLNGDLLNLANADPEFGSYLQCLME